MEQFLLRSRHNLVKLSEFNLIHFVIGNESCDLDSAVSSLVVAYMHDKLTYENSKESLVLPILNVKRKQLKLRNEITFWIQEAAKLDLKLLICKDEIDWDQIKNGKQKVIISLVDHNVDKEFESLGTIVQIVDHHQQVPSENSSCKDENYDQLVDKEIIPGVGSCCSLVAKRYLNFLKKTSTLNSEDNQNCDSDVQIALLLYGPVILDTICFSKSSNRFTFIDEEAASQLESLMGSDSVTRQEVYQQLINAKNRPASSLEEYFEKDLKIATIDISSSESSSSSTFSSSSSSLLPSIATTVTIAVPSISGQLIRDLFTSQSIITNEEKSNASSQAVSESSDVLYVTSSLLDQLEKFRQTVSTNCLAVVILGIINTDPSNIKRDLALYSPYSTILNMLSEKVKSPSSSLQLTCTSVKVNSKSDSSVPQNHSSMLSNSSSSSSSSSSSQLHLYSQSNITASRKAILPLIYEVLTDSNSKAHLLQAAYEDIDKRAEFTCDERVDDQVKMQKEKVGKKIVHEMKKKEENKVDYTECTYISSVEEEEEEKKEDDEEEEEEKCVPQVTSLYSAASELGGAEKSSDHGPKNFSEISHSPYLDVSKISTAHVDPEFVLTYTTETVDSPESPKLLSPIHIRAGSSLPGSVTQGEKSSKKKHSKSVVSPVAISSKEVGEVVTCPRYPQQHHSSHTDHNNHILHHHHLDSFQSTTCTNNITTSTNTSSNDITNSSINNLSSTDKNINKSKCATLSFENSNSNNLNNINNTSSYSDSYNNSHLHIHQCEKNRDLQSQSLKPTSPTLPTSLQQQPQPQQQQQQQQQVQNFQGSVNLDQGSLRNYFISGREEGEENNSIQPNIQPTSINYYESYFDDSYVGDFSGEVEVNQVTSNDNNCTQFGVDPSTLLWCSDPDLNPSLLEFTYDSFGPESFVFNNLASTTNNTSCSSSSSANCTADNLIADLKVTSLDDKVNSSSVNDDQQQQQQINMKDNSVNIESETITSSSDVVISDEKNLIINQQESIMNSLNDNVINKLSVFSSSNQSSHPTSLPCSDSSGSSASRTSSAMGTFSRSSTLSRSQRRKILPKIDLEQILNASDDVTNTTVDESNTMLDLDCEKLKSAQLLDDDLRMNPDGAPDSIYETTGHNHNSYYSYLVTINDGLSNEHNSNVLGHTLPNGNQTKSLLKQNYHEENIHQQNYVEDSSRWMRSHPIDGMCKPIDLRVIEPYKKVISHAGYYHQFNSVQLARNNLHTATGPAIITFSACYLPDRSRRDYNYVMDHLFMYVLTTLHELVADDYILIYFHNPNGSSSTSGNNMPTFSWLKRCYQMIDRKLRKNLKSLYLVHPTFWLKTLVIMTRPLLSSKFYRKLRFVSTLRDLNESVPMEPALIPPPVKQLDEYFEARATN